MVPTQEHGNQNKVEKMSHAEIDVTLNKVAGFNSHNRSRFTLKKLVADQNPIAANLECTASCNLARNQGKGMHSPTRERGNEVKTREE